MVKRKDTDLTLGVTLVSEPSCERTKCGALALSASNTSMPASSRAAGFGPGRWRGVLFRDFLGTSVLSLYELLLPMLKLDTESSIHMLLLCSESGLGSRSSWQDIRLSSSKSSGGGEMLRTVRRFEGVAWLCVAPTVSPTAAALIVTTEPGSTPILSGIPSVAGPLWSLEACSWAEVAESMLGQEGSVLLSPPGEEAAAQVAAASVVCTMQNV